MTWDQRVPFNHLGLPLEAAWPRNVYEWRDNQIWTDDLTFVYSGYKGRTKWNSKTFGGIISFFSSSSDDMFRHSIKGKLQGVTCTFRKRGKRYGAIVLEYPENAT